MQPIPDVTKNLLIINVLMFLLQMSVPFVNEYFALYSVLSDKFRPVQLVTHMFMHGNFMHIFFNMFALYIFGRDTEYALGPKRFFAFYMIAGLGAAFLQSAVNYIELSQWAEADAVLYKQVVNIPMVGASGAVFGLLAAFGLLYPNRILVLMFPPIPMRAKYFVLLYGALELYMAVSQNSVGGGVAHFAHVGGALFGAAMILFWRSRGNRF